VIVSEQDLRTRFESGAEVVRALAALSRDIGATALADYSWDVAGDRGPVRQLRRATPMGLIGVTEEPGSVGGTWSLRIQLVSWKATADIAVVRYDTPADGYWEMHLGDGSPRRIQEENVGPAMAFLAVALAAVAKPFGVPGSGRSQGLTEVR
jgi:hypothetical protein